MNLGIDGNGLKVLRVIGRASMITLSIFGIGLLTLMIRPEAHELWKQIGGWLAFSSEGEYQSLVAMFVTIGISIFGFYSLMVSMDVISDSTIDISNKVIVGIAKRLGLERGMVNDFCDRHQKTFGFITVCIGGLAVFGMLRLATSGSIAADQNAQISERIEELSNPTMSPEDVWIKFSDGTIKKGRYVANQDGSLKVQLAPH